MDPERYPKWRQLYREAVFEPDPGKLAIRIAQAHDAIHYRRLELWHSGGADVRERGELDVASYCLGLLGNFSGKIHGSEPAAVVRSLDPKAT
jgi:hypothetical protein